jgi:hypothetical protein
LGLTIAGIANMQATMTARGLKPSRLPASLAEALEASEPFNA